MSREIAESFAYKQLAAIIKRGRRFLRACSAAFEASGLPFMYFHALACGTGMRLIGILLACITKTQHPVKSTTSSWTDVSSQAKTSSSPLCLFYQSTIPYKPCLLSSAFCSHPQRQRYPKSFQGRPFTTCQLGPKGPSHTLVKSGDWGSPKSSVPQMRVDVTPAYLKISRPTLVRHEAGPKKK